MTPLPVPTETVWTVGGAGPLARDGFWQVIIDRLSEVSLAGILFSQIWLRVRFQHLFLSQALVRHGSLPKMTFVSSTLGFFLFAPPFIPLFSLRRWSVEGPSQGHSPARFSGSEPWLWSHTVRIQTLRPDGLSCVTWTGTFNDLIGLMRAVTSPIFSTWFFRETPRAMPAA